MTMQQKQMVGVAVASLVLGIAGMILIGPLGSIPAVICGHIAMSRIKKNPDMLTGGGLALAGLIMGYVQIGFIVIIMPLLAAIAIPSFVHSRNLAQQNRCINNLRMIDAGKQQAAIEMGWADDTDCDVPSNASNVNAYIKGGAPTCPSGGTYTYNDVQDDPECDIEGHEMPR